jgi:hypothetical protein
MTNPLRNPPEIARRRASTAFRVLVGVAGVGVLLMVLSVIAVVVDSRPPNVLGQMYAAILFVIMVACRAAGTYLLLPFGIIDLLVGPAPSERGTRGQIRMALP